MLFVICLMVWISCKTVVWTVVILSVAATYFIVIETAKMYDLEVRDYFVHVVCEIMNGNKGCSIFASESFLALKANINV